MKAFLLSLILSSTALASYVVPDGAVTVQKLNAQTSQGPDLLNCSLTLSAASNILTIALKDKAGSTPSAVSACVGSFRSSTATTGTFNQRRITSALSQTLTAGTILQMPTSINAYLWFYLIDSDGSGTMKLGASSYRLDEASLQSSVAESFSATATNASPCVFTANGHGLNNGDTMQLTGTPPTGFSTGTTYFVVSSATNTFQLAATLGGAAKNSTSTGSAIVAHIQGSRLVSDAAYSSKPVRILGRGQFNLATPGQWTTPSELSPLPMLGNMSSGGPTGMRVESMYMDTCTTSTCTVGLQTGNFISRVTRNSTGSYTITFAQGAFSGPPLCTCNNQNNGRVCSSAAGVVPTSSSTMGFSIANGSGTATDDPTVMICMGPR